MSRTFEEAMHELKIKDDAEPLEKLRAACQWHIGDPYWANTFLEWAKDAGYEIKEPK